MTAPNTAAPLVTPAPVNFPQIGGHYEFTRRHATTFSHYALESRRVMRQWVVQSFAAHPDGFPCMETYALLVAHETAVDEIRRALTQNEARLLGECVRDVMMARHAMPTSDVESQRACELSRGVL